MPAVQELAGGLCPRAWAALDSAKPVPGGITGDARRSDDIALGLCGSGSGKAVLSR